MRLTTITWAMACLALAAPASAFAHGDKTSLAEHGFWNPALVPIAAAALALVLFAQGFVQGTFTPSFESFLATVHPHDRSFVEATVSRTRKRGEPIEYEFRMLRSGGEVRTIYARGIVVEDDDGTPIAVVGTAQDITERKEIETERERLLAAEQAARADAETAHAQVEVQNERLRELEVQVTDTGRGIPQKDHVHLFERFFRGDGAGDRAVEGTGLGLWISKAIVEAHGGKIAVESKPGRGTTFCVELPGAARE